MFLSACEFGVNNYNIELKYRKIT